MPVAIWKGSNTLQLFHQAYSACPTPSTLPSQLRPPTAYLRFRSFTTMRVMLWMHWAR